MTPHQFLDVVEQRGVLEAALVSDLREQVSQLEGRVTPAEIAQLLVDNGYLTRQRADKLLREAGAGGLPGGTAAEDDEVVLLDGAELEPDTGFRATADDSEDAPIDLDAIDLVPAGRKSGKGKASGQPLDDLLDTALPGGGTALGIPPKRRSYIPQTIKGNRWDSKLILGGSGLLLFLMIAFAFLYISLTRGTAAEMFEAAETDYRSEAYTQAIAKYDRFLDKYPDDPNASLARVRRGTARMRAVVGGDPVQALNVSRDVLPEIEAEASFAEARPELASMLPSIAEGFVTRAKQAALAGNMARAEEHVQQADAAMELVNNPSYIPTTLRTPLEGRIGRIVEDVALVRRDINRDKELSSTAVAIDQALSEGNTAAAYTSMDQLLAKYPGLENNEAVLEARLRIAEKQRELVRVVTEPIMALTEPVEQASAGQVVLAHRGGSAAGRPDEEVVFVAAGGAAYGLQVNSGQVLWHYRIGNQTAAHPQPLGPQAGADALVVDGQRQELVRLQAADGQLVWRLPLGESAAAPARAGDQLLVSTQAGRVLLVDPQSGTASRHALLPQPVRVAAVGDERRPHLYQLAEHSNIYVLSKESLECREVFYLGHKPGSVQVAPAMSLGHLLVAENAGADYSLVHVLASDEQGLKLRRPQDPFRLSGRVLTPPVVFGRNVLMVTDLGGVHVFDVDPAAANRPVTVVAQTIASATRPMMRYPAVSRLQLWVGDYRLTKYVIQTSRGELARQWIKGDGDIYVSPIQVFGDVLVQVRQPANASGATVSAVRGEDAGALWQVDLAVPAARPVPDASSARLDVISERGALFEVALDQAAGTRIIDQPAAAEGREAAAGFSQSVKLPEGREAFFAATDPRQILLYDPQKSAQRLRLVALPVEEGDRVTAPLVPLEGGLLMPVQSGRVLLVDPQTGDPMTLPFQPPLEGGAQLDWQRPAVAANRPGEFIISDGRGALYRVAVQQQPRPHLAQMTRVTLETSLYGPLAAVSDTLYAVTRGSDQDELLAFALPDLAAGERWPLEGRVVFGPHAVGDVVLVATDRGRLICFESGQKQRWAAPLEHGPLVGLPTLDSGGLWLASVQGRVWKLGLDSGEALGEAELGQPLASGPVIFGDQVVVPGGGGTLLFTSALN